MSVPLKKTTHTTLTTFYNIRGGDIMVGNNGANRANLLLGRRPNG